MKKYFFLLLFSLLVLLSACTQQGEAEPVNDSGVINDGKVLGYAYTITLEQGEFTWKIGNKKNTTTIIEGAENEQNLANFKKAVDDSYVELVDFIITIAYLLIVAVTTLILYKKKSNMLKGGGVIIALITIFSLCHAVVTAVDISHAFQEAEYFYLLLTN
ncbi:hypothetical protein MUN88_06635 [Gracilibacillus caseinilyticus]|uniref:Uncharacterized protein n=1 Tax=Gracilibacillus caseinilyticus TaxID=2932256 RepID=A0ABY4EZC1_9BACI|nr:hypothetical protein [Gracilibacillus caseinilyticus]UOQ49750.1 hypothetical protein MUN88_06635 [Gracilibacillus caseinilyticus]